MVRNVRFQFPVFLIYPRERTENLPGNMGFERRNAVPGGVCIRTIVKNPRICRPRRKLRQGKNQHLPDSAFIADQLYQLIDSILFQQVFRRCCCSASQYTGTSDAERFPRQPRHVSQPRACIVFSGVRVWHANSSSVRQLIKRGVLRFTVTTLPETDRIFVAGDLRA